MLFGIAFGLLIERAQICFTSAFRDMSDHRPDGDGEGDYLRHGGERHRYLQLCAIGDGAENYVGRS